VHSRNSLPLIGITMGDPSGIGPEIIVKALLDRHIYEICNPVVIGDRNTIFQVIERLALGDKISLDIIHNPEQGIFSTACLRIPCFLAIVSRLSFGMIVEHSLI